MVCFPPAQTTISIPSQTLSPPNPNSPYRNLRLSFFKEDQNLQKELLTYRRSVGLQMVVRRQLPLDQFSTPNPFSKYNISTADATYREKEKPRT